MFPLRRSAASHIALLAAGLFTAAPMPAVQVVEKREIYESRLAGFDARNLKMKESGVIDSVALI